VTTSSRPRPQKKPLERLSRIRVRGFRSIRDLDLPLAQLNILIGANGSGKSNFIGLFHLLSYLVTGSLRLYTSRQGDASSILHYGPKRTPTLEAELHFQGEANRSEYAFTLAHAAPDRFLFAREQVAFHTEGKDKPFTKVLDAGGAETQLTELAATAAASTGRKVARVFLERLKRVQVYHFHDTSPTAPIRLSQDVDRTNLLLSTGGNLASFLFMLRQEHAAHYQRIVATIRLAVPYFEDFELAPQRHNASRIQLRWRDRSPDYEFGPHQFSDGSLRAIALITALLQPEELLPDVLVIDEPELGLHPSAISLIASLILAVSQKRQVIVATQSPKLLASFSPADVIVASRDEDGTGHGESTFQRLRPDHLKSWLEQYDLGQLFDMNVTGGGPQ
jgi:predicted ATPase